jgi:hypothetical protein
MITISKGSVLGGVAGTAAVIDYSIMGSEKSQYDARDVKTLAQGELDDEAAALYTAPTVAPGRIEAVFLANTSGTAVTGVYLTVDDYQITPALTIPAHGAAVYGPDGWKTYTTVGEISVASGGTATAFPRYGAAATTADGGAITHGFSAAPTVVLVCGSIDTEMVAVTAIGSTTFTVAIKTALGASGTTQTIYWVAIP